ncbi:MAG: hypothetical protein AAF613_06685 [Pseudomonadota bacterium]
MIALMLCRATRFARPLAISAGLVSAFALPSAGSVADRPHFKVDGVAIVWAADSAGAAPIASDFIIEDGGANTDLIGTDVTPVLTGTLDPLDDSYADDAGATLRIQRIADGPNQDTRANGDRVTDASDSFTAFELDATTDVRTIRSDIFSSFYVASNKAFNIDVVSSAVGDPADLNLIRLRVRIRTNGTDGGLSWGSASQRPHTGNSATSGLTWTNYRRLSNLTGGQTLFTGNRRTAIAPGTIPDQSVRFDLDYRWNTGNIDLSEGVFDVEAEVEYTVYIP